MVQSIHLRAAFPTTQAEFFHHYFLRKIHNDKVRIEGIRRNSAHCQNNKFIFFKNYTKRNIVRFVLCILSIHEEQWAATKGTTFSFGTVLWSKALTGEFYLNVHVFGDGENGATRENSHKHKENMQTPCRKAVLQRGLLALR